jgi:hypothetical protein
MGRLPAKCSGAVLAGALLALAGMPASPASADPPAPGDVRSTVDGISPVVDGVSAEIVGGDSFLRLRVEPGREVVVAGYEGEPYLRFRPDGAVEVNRRSPASVLNESRFGGDPASGTDAAAPPAWDQVASDGAYEWHDHRTHWMATTRPEPPVRTWAVPIRVDGVGAEITGRYRYVAPPSAWPWLIGGAALAVVAVVAGRRWWRGLGLVVAGAALALGVYGLALARLPGGTSGVVTSLLALLGLAGAIGAVTAREARRGPLLAGAGVALLVAGWREVDVLWHSVLTTSWPPTLERLVVVIALGGGVAATVAGFAQSLGAYQPSGTSASASGGPHEPRA